MPRTPKADARKPLRGRPKMSEEKRDLMRRRISDVAESLFETDGYTKISMRRIAREVGCTPMALYNYYDAKIDILRTLWQGIFETVFARISSFQRDGEPLEYLIKISSIYVQYWLEHPDHYRLVFMTEGVSQPDVSFFLGSDQTLQQFAVFGEAISKATKESINPIDLKVKVDMLACILHGVAHNLITMSGYPWTNASKLVEIGIFGLMSDRPVTALDRGL